MIEIRSHSNNHASDQASHPRSYSGISRCPSYRVLPDGTIPQALDFQQRRIMSVPASSRAGINNIHVTSYGTVESHWPTSPSSNASHERLPSYKSFGTNTVHFGIDGRVVGLGPTLTDYAHVRPNHPPQPNIHFSAIALPMCPRTRRGHHDFVDDFTCLGVSLAILLFPIGIICCLGLRENRYVHCGYLLQRH